MISPDDWRPIDQMRFEPNALGAITALDCNTVVSAGPGAGKTELLAQRADFLFRTGRCPYPRRVLAVSFKVDAARNLDDRVRIRSGAQLSRHFDSFTFHAFAKRLIDNFRLVLTGEKALDPDYSIDEFTRIPHKQITYDDLLPLALEIIETNQYARNGLRQTYSHVLLDEFQDCTSLQYKLLKAVFVDTDTILTAVGDTKQRIMTWAGALEGVMQTFANDFSAETFPLYQNFRSAPRLRRMQNRMIAQMDPLAVSPSEDLVGEEGMIDVLGYANEYDEANAVAKNIQEWLSDGTEPNEIVILVRQQTHMMTAALRQALNNEQIPFRNEQKSQNLSAEPAAELILNFLRIIADEGQSEAYSELLHVSKLPHRSDEEAARFDSKLKHLLHESRGRVRDSQFHQTDTSSWKELVDKFLQLITRPSLLALSPSYSQGETLDEVVSEIFDAFTQEIDRCGNVVQALKRLSHQDSVRLSTIHKSKGLEFEKVVILGVEYEAFWGDATEAMSVYFVGVSRAKSHLVLTYSQRRERPAQPVKVWHVRRKPQWRYLAFANEV